MPHTSKTTKKIKNKIYISALFVIFAFAMASWKKITAKTDTGAEVEMLAPEIISASRSTDIPAFYSDWFFHRLKTGYSVWTNPFNGVRSYVSYSNVKFIVFWSKNPKPLLKYLPYLKDKGIGCYIQYTLNDYENEELEPGVPALKDRIETFRKLASILGKDAVIWRFDPLILTENINVDNLLERIYGIGEKIKSCCSKLVFSYVDILSYRKVRANLEKSGIKWIEWTPDLMEDFAFRLHEINADNKWNLQLATCSEKINLERFGIKHNSCIDGNLIARLSWKNAELMKVLGIKIMQSSKDLFGNTLPEGAVFLPDSHYFMPVHKKDKGQRLFCDCMAAKDIGEYNTCPHLCEYCYANTSKETAISNWKKHKENPFSKTITGL